MSEKKKQQAANSQVDERQIQEILGHYHQIAGTLHESQDQQQADAALTTISALTEAEQLALLKALSKERDTDAADVATALYELSPSKSVRKEARRSLIRLQELRIYPKWSTPVPRVSALDQFLETDIDIANTPMRFWKRFCKIPTTIRRAWFTPTGLRSGAIRAVNTFASSASWPCCRRKHPLPRIKRLARGLGSFGTA